MTDRLDVPIGPFSLDRFTQYLECPSCGEVSDFQCREDQETGYLHPASDWWECPVCQEEWR